MFLQIAFEGLFKKLLKVLLFPTTHFKDRIFPNKTSYTVESQEI